MEQLRQRTGPKGFDVYCHVCWTPVYALWAADDPPDHDKCPMGDFDEFSCPNAQAHHANAATIAKLRESGLLAPEGT